jgi:hypothetical protein
MKPSLFLDDLQWMILPRSVGREQVLPAKAAAPELEWIISDVEDLSRSIGSWQNYLTRSWMMKNPVS